MPVPKPGLGMLRACATVFRLWLLMPARETFYHQWKTFPTISALVEWGLFICPLSAAGPPLFCHTGDISLLVPSSEGPLGIDLWPGRCHSQTDGCSPWSGGVQNFLGRICQLLCLNRGCGRGVSLSAAWLAAPFALWRICLGAFWSSQQ